MVAIWSICSGVVTPNNTPRLGNVNPNRITSSERHSVYVGSGPPSRRSLAAVAPASSVCPPGMILMSSPSKMGSSAGVQSGPVAYGTAGNCWRGTWRQLLPRHSGGQCHPEAGTPEGSIKPLVVRPKVADPSHAQDDTYAHAQDDTAPVIREVAASV